MPKMHIEAGKEYGYWTVIVAKPGRSLCSCRCGLVKEVQNRILGSKTRFPKCRACSVKNQPQNHKGSMRKTGRQYKSSLPPAIYRRCRKAAKWAIHRCTNPLYPQWKDYGGRGIKVYREWLDDPSKFVHYLASLPGVDNPDLYLDRINNDGNYEPGNLRFVTPLVSCHNRRNSRPLKDQ